MNTANIKKYAPKARNAFISAVTKRANELGIYDSHIAEAKVEGQTLNIEGRSVDLQLKGVREKLIKRVESAGFTALMEQVAYTWFNRLCAIRYMELHDYLDHGVRVLSSGEGLGARGEWGIPEILSHAQDVADDLSLNRDDIIELKLAGNQDELLYRTLLLGQCHKLHQAMPFLFEAIDDETEILLPDNLTRTDSILRGLVNDIPEQDWEQVEVIGWLYQFYISEKKDEVIGKVVKSEDIPAATQLFTPNWIVKYLVQNSVGRLWLQTYPDSGLKSEMEYYIELASEEVGSGECGVASNIEKLTTNHSSLTTQLNPEDLKILDPACGSGHILVEAYQTLKAIYEERGYRNRDIPKLILEKNLYGLDIDDRAAQLAGFTLMMLARADDRRIFTRDVQLNVMAMQSTAGMTVMSDEWRVVSDEQERQGLVLVLQDLLALFKQAKTFGSLIEVPDSIAEYLPTVKRVLKQLADSGDVFAQHAALTLMPIIKQAEILAQKYDVVVANPPYMGSKYQIPTVKKYLKDNFKDYEKDLFSTFIIRNQQLAKEQGQLGFMTPFVWMFISSYEKLREKLLTEATITTLIQLEYSGFDGATVPICTFTLSANHIKDYIGSYIKLSDFKGHQNQAPKTLEAIKNPNCGWFYNAKPDDFKKIPGSPIAYWVSENIRRVFVDGVSLKEIGDTRQGMATSDNNRFLRVWPEVNFNKVCLLAESRDEACASGKKWFPYNKGGDFRKWYGNSEFFINWENNGNELLEYASSLYGSPTRTIKSISEYFKPCVSWSKISSGNLAMRYYPAGFIFDVAGCCIFNPSEKKLMFLLGYTNTSIVRVLLASISPTLNFEAGQVATLPILSINYDGLSKLANKLVQIAKIDWNTYETSWDFQNNPLISGEWLVTSDELKEEKLTTPHSSLTTQLTTQSLATLYTKWQTHNRQTIVEMQRLEEENNRLFIEAYGLQDELTPDVPLEQITLTVNPYYRYKVKSGECEEVMSSECRVASNAEKLTTNHSSLITKKLEERFQSDTLAELISYAIGCMMGRYRIDRPGLIYAHSGNKDFWEIYEGVMSDEWRVASEELSGLGCMAEVDGIGGENIPNEQSISERRVVRIDESNSSSSGFDTIKYSGRSSEEINSGISEFPIDSSGFKGGSGNTNVNSGSPEVCDTWSNQGDTRVIGGNIENAQLTEKQINTLKASDECRVGSDELKEEKLNSRHSSLTTHHFKADDDGIIPLTDQEWFADDATHRFREFVRVVWGEDNLQANLDFVAESLCLYAIKPKRGESSLDTIRRYLSSQFYKDHLKTYKKRPIYWLFSSGKQKAFECLVYLHRYNESTLSRMRTEYVTPLLGKYESYAQQLQKQLEDAASTAEANRFKKALTALEKKQTELSEFNDKLKHYADMRISLDLDDGVKVNYGKFGDLLAEVKAITGKKG